MLKVLLLILLGTSLFANMGTILLMPKNATFDLSPYVGYGYSDIKIKTESTDIILDGQYNYLVESYPTLGLYIALQNEYYTFSFGGDYSKQDMYENARGYMNFDYTHYANNKNAAFVIGIGLAANETYVALESTQKQFSTATYLFRTGFRFALGEDELECLIEYATLTNTKNKAYSSQDDHFSTYYLKQNDTVLLRLAYRFNY